MQYSKQTLLQPESEEALNNLGAAYYLSSKFDKATESWSKALSIRQSANVYSNLGTSLFFERRFMEAVPVFQQAVRLNPNSYFLTANLADAMKFVPMYQQESLEHYTKALEKAKQRVDINPRDLTALASMLRYHAELGECEASQARKADLDRESFDDPYIYYDLAIAASQCELPYGVLYYLKQAWQLGYPHNLLIADPQFEPYRDEIEKFL